MVGTLSAPSGGTRRATSSPGAGLTGRGWCGRRAPCSAPLGDVPSVSQTLCQADEQLSLKRGSRHQ